MGRYAAGQGIEGETEPGSRGRVLRNLAGVTRKREMDQREFEALMASQEAALHRFTAETRFTAALLCEMHRDWLGGLYAWAGQYRTVEMAKGGFRWPPAYLVERNMAAFEAGLLAKHTPCPPGSIEETARRMAEVHAELLLIHPFRDGNGRLARWLANLMAIQAGYQPLDYGFEGRGGRLQRETYLSAVVAGYACRYDALTGFFRLAIERSLSDGGAGPTGRSPRAPSNTDD